MADCVKSSDIAMSFDMGSLPQRKKSLPGFRRFEKERMYKVPNAQPLKRVIRSKESGRFFKDGDWTENPDEATNFASAADAAQACSTYQLRNAELILWFGRKELDVSLPICQD